MNKVILSFASRNPVFIEESSETDKMLIKSQEARIIELDQQFNKIE